MTNTNLTLFICDLLTALGFITALLGGIIVLFSISLQPLEGQKAKTGHYGVVATKNLRTGLAFMIVGLLMCAISAIFELMIY